MSSVSEHTALRSLSASKTFNAISNWTDIRFVVHSRGLFFDMVYSYKNGVPH